MFVAILSSLHVSCLLGIDSVTGAASKPYQFHFRFACLSKTNEAILLILFFMLLPYFLLLNSNPPSGGLIWFTLFKSLISP
jgi:hypothetical protein